MTDNVAIQARWVLYILRTADARYYTGITTDLQRRHAEHSEGGRLAAKAVRGRAPLHIVYTATFPDRSQASAAEYRVKQLHRSAKERLIAGELAIQELLAEGISV